MPSKFMWKRIFLAPKKSSDHLLEQIGDKVQLVEDFEKYLDEPGGPLRPGERGIVVQVQEGLNGCR